MKKTAMKWLLPLICLSVALYAFALTGHAEIIASGNCGEIDKEKGLDGSQLQWTLDENGLLTISGQGTMCDYYGWNSGEDEGPRRPWDFNAVKAVRIDNEVTSIGGQAFCGCSDLTSVQLGNGITSIGDYAFTYCTKLSAVHIPDSVKTIGWRAFEYCSGLYSVRFPNSLEHIGFEAFDACSNLTDIFVPDSVNHIEGGAFNSTPWYEMQPDGLVYAGNVAYHYKGMPPQQMSVNIKNGTKGIAGYFLSNTRGTKGGGKFEAGTEELQRNSLTSVHIPTSATAIGDNAFGTWALSSVLIPDNITEIGYGSFPKDTVIYGYSDSYAQQWANENNMVFRLIGELAGDPDADGRITSADARLALRACVELEDYVYQSAQYLACDADGDGKLTAEDARLILRASVGLEIIPEVNPFEEP